jgi:hypothetical protein
MHKYDLEAIIKDARRKGYFAVEDYPGLRLSLEEFQILGKKLGKLPQKKPNDSIEKAKSLRAVNAMRTGTVAAECVTAYSVGRTKLLEHFKHDLKEVANNRSLVRFLNADLGQGKTHALNLLREFAFEMDFPVSLVSLSQHGCPLHDFGLVYNKVVWCITTREERQKAALENIFQRWLDMARRRGEEEAAELVKKIRGHDSGLREDVVNALGAYCTASSIVSPNKERQQQVLEWFSASRTYVSDLRKLGIRTQIVEHNAVEMLSILAELFRNLGYKGMCILFDEAEAIHSFSNYSQRDRAYGNLLKLTEAAGWFPHCYFLYATTPSFFDAYSHYWPFEQSINARHIYELERLSISELKALAQKISDIYCTAYGWTEPSNVKASLERLAEAGIDSRIGDFVRGCISFLDEKRG